ncbi:hypothetical protein FCR2A7T_22700 [Flavobacterium cauense R2A-7]|nr:hypothetical protein FCR2A7T_22700 [Flavobacterium cauense R2A-7]
MKKTQNTRFTANRNNIENNLLSNIQQIVFSIKSIQNFDVLEFPNPLHDELQIIYANIRV